ncbi:GTPase domain-containing protein [bacterium]|nr:GTPase domain-containing protein [bacterium]
MVFFNYATMEMAAKIVYYGPGLCGKTTNLQFIYNKTSRKTRGEMVSLATETDRTLFFDLLPIRLGTVGGFKTRFQLYTVPGQVFYNSTRKLVLKGVDAVVFVADSQEPMLDANIESLENLEENLAEHRLDLESVPWVIQYNKRDLPHILTIEELEKELNQYGVPYYESVATIGKGVLETLKGISKLTLKYLRRKTGDVPAETPRFQRPSTIAVSSKSSAVNKEQESEEEDINDVEFDVSGGAEVSEAGEIEVAAIEAHGADRKKETVKQTADTGSEMPEEQSDDVGVSVSDSQIDVSVTYTSGEPGKEYESDEVDGEGETITETYSDGEVIEKVVTKKIVIPINISKDEKFKNINLNLKLEVECQVIEGDHRTTASTTTTTKKTKTSASALAQKTLEDFLLGKKK